jgi:hypothetical protein
VDLEALDALKAKATPTPWDVAVDAILVDNREQVCCGQATQSGECCGCPDIVGDYGPIEICAPDNAAFIAGLVNAYPALAAELRALRAEQHEDTGLLAHQKEEIDRLRAERDQLRADLEQRRRYTPEMVTIVAGVMRDKTRQRANYHDRATAVLRALFCK